MAMPAEDTMTAGPVAWLMSIDSWTVRAARKGSGLIAASPPARDLGP
ncbi:hypothetical protein ACFYRL_30800 [Streptomyces goshikiensis]